MRRLLSLWLGTATPLDLKSDLRKPLLELLSWASTLSPLVAPDVVPEWARGKESFVRFFFGLNFDVTGCEKLFEGEPNIIRRAYTGAVERGYVPRIAIAPSLGSAWAFSRFGERPLTIVSKSKLRPLLSKLPVESLRLAPSVMMSLNDLNVSAVGQLMLLPRSTLLTRFGPAVIDRLDQALGHTEEPLITSAPIGPLRAEKVFLTPIVSPESLEKTVSLLLQRLLSRLSEQTQKPSHLLLEIFSHDQPLFARELLLAFPTGDPNHLWNLIRTQLEQVNIGRGIERVTLVAYRTAAIKPEKHTFLPEEQSARTFFTATQECGKLLDVLGEYLGPEEVFSLAPQASHIPERSYAFKPLKNGIASLNEPHQAANTAPIELASERPSLLFRSPLAIQVMALLPDHPPFWLKWREKRYRIHRACGPERIAPEWWGKDAELFTTRDYFQVQLQGGIWLWIYREQETQEWYLHGIWC